MKIIYYHPSFEYQDEYAPKNGQKGIECDAERIVCPRCNGEGHHFRNDLDENLMVGSFQEDGDGDGFQAYRRGAFDQRCEECHGEKIVDEVLAGMQDQITQYKEADDNKRKKLMGGFMGPLMKASKGQGNPKLFNEILSKKLND